jgi:hypothetical protein
MIIEHGCFCQDFTLVKHERCLYVLNNKLFIFYTLYHDGHILNNDNSVTFEN